MSQTDRKTEACLVAFARRMNAVLRQLSAENTLKVLPSKTTLVSSNAEVNASITALAKNLGEGFDMTGIDAATAAYQQTANEILNDGKPNWSLPESCADLHAAVSVLLAAVKYAIELIRGRTEERSTKPVKVAPGAAATMAEASAPEPSRAKEPGNMLSACLMNLAKDVDDFVQGANKLKEMSGDAAPANKHETLNTRRGKTIAQALTRMLQSLDVLKDFAPQLDWKNADAAAADMIKVVDVSAEKIDMALLRSTGATLVNQARSLIRTIAPAAVAELDANSRVVPQPTSGRTSARASVRLRAASSVLEYLDSGRPRQAPASTTELVLMPPPEVVSVDGSGTGEPTAAATTTATAASGTAPAEEGISGFLTKRGAMFHSWKKRWHVLEGIVLYYFKERGQRACLGRVILSGYTAEDTAAGQDKPNAFSLVKAGSRTYMFSAADAATKNAWVTALRRACLLANSENAPQPTSLRPVLARMFRFTTAVGTKEAKTAEESASSAGTTASSGGSSAAAMSGAGASAGAPSDGLLTTDIVREGDDEVLILENGVVMAGTADRLVSQLCSEQTVDKTYVSIFLLTFRHIMTPLELMTLLTARFNVVPPPSPTEAEIAYVNKWRPIIRVRVIDVVSMWALRYWFDFHNNLELMHGLESLIATVVAATDVAAPDRMYAGKLPNLIADNLRAYERQLNAEESPSITATTTLDADADMAGAASDGVAAAPELVRLLDFEPDAIAQQLTWQEYDGLTRVRPEMFVTQLWASKQDSPFLEAFAQPLSDFVEQFNRVSYWVATELCLCPVLSTRVELACFFINVAEQLFQMRNYNSVMGIVSGLNVAAVQRLKQMWRDLPRRSMKKLEVIEAHMDPTGSYKQYRQLSMEPPCIPFICLGLRDLTFFNDGNPRKISSGLYSFDKLRRIATTVNNLCICAPVLPAPGDPSGIPPVPPRYAVTRNAAVQDYLERAVVLEEGPLYKYSLLCEPRAKEEAQSDSKRLIEKWMMQS